ncbi:hypothetical protein Q1695_003134 [Nippostrongylus brasiliensis]|nr:hypothetical protein Q1695_003134 [Nippostrongylus brasiliensis]
MISLLLLVVFTAAARAQTNDTLNTQQSLALTISPKVWDLLETKANFITEAVRSIKFPEKEEKVAKLVKYKVWGGQIEQFTVPKSGVAFVDVNNGVHIRMTGIQFRGKVSARLTIGRKIGRVRVSGDIQISSTSAELDMLLKWNDFNFIPTVSMNSELRVDFTHHLRRFNMIRKHVQNLATKAANKKISDAIINDVNPRLQKLKKMVEQRVKDYDVVWTVQNQILRVEIRPRSSTGQVSPVKAIDKMLCVDLNLNHLLSSRSKRSVLAKGVDVTCVDPVAKCEGQSCSFCTNVDINPGPSGDMFHNCIPAF